MAANILNSDRAVEASVQVVRAFVRLRNLVSTHKEIAAQLAKLRLHIAQQHQTRFSVFEFRRQFVYVNLP